MVAKLVLYLLPVVALVQANYPVPIPFPSGKEAIQLDADRLRAKDNANDYSQWNKDAVNAGDWEQRLLNENRRKENAHLNADNTKAYNYNPYPTYAHYGGYGYPYAYGGGCPTGGVSNYENNRLNAGYNLDDFGKQDYLNRGNIYQGFHADGLDKSSRNQEIEKDNYKLNAATAFQGYPQHYAPAPVPVAPASKKLYF